MDIVFMIGYKYMMVEMQVLELLEDIVELRCPRILLRLQTKFICGWEPIIQYHEQVKSKVV